MTASEPVGETPTQRAGAVRRHGRALGEIAVASLVGIAATAVFQLVAIRSFPPETFGLLAAFLAIVNVVAVGSSALRNSVAVGIAEVAAEPPLAPRERQLDAGWIEALVLGGIVGLVLAATAPVLASALGTAPLVVLLTAIVVLPHFVFARAQGRLQGASRTRAVVWWTSGTQVAQLALLIVLVLVGAGLIEVLVMVLFVTAAAAVLATAQARRIPSLPGRAFSRRSVVVLSITLSFAWLSNADIVLVRAGADAGLAGGYAAAGVLAKAVMLVSATLSVYLLPRFVANRGDVATSRRDVGLTLAATVAIGLLGVAALALLGPLVVDLLFSAEYDVATAILPGLAAMWVPWAGAQTVLIRATASASPNALIVLVGAGVAQVLAALALPDLALFMVLNGLLGVLVLVALLVIPARIDPDRRA